MVIFHEPSVSIVSGPGALPPLSVSGPGAVSVLCVGPQRSLCPAPAVSVLGPGALCVVLSVLGPALSVSGRSALCLGARRSLCRGGALRPLSVSGPSVSGPAALSVRLGPQHSPFCVRPHRSLCRAPARRSLCRAPALAGALVSGPALFVWGSVSRPGTLLRFLCRTPAFSVGVGVGARRSSPKTFFVRSRRSMCRSRRFLYGPGALYVGAQRSVCRGPTICVSGPGALCVGAALCVRGPTLFVSGPARGPAGTLCVGAQRLSASGPGALRATHPVPRPPSSIRTPSIPIRVPPSSDARASSEFCKKRICANLRVRKLDNKDMQQETMALLQCCQQIVGAAQHRCCLLLR